uniref:DUF3536 domain-containing protein n=1 Tax=candidate division WOR-3 bacterium TaxID=2052148 RepID=A0A7C4U994_UNCW3
MERYICIHSHFYQPPRENPWLEDVQLQDSAYPYHDWNERITSECYEANIASRILNDKGKIVEIMNNYTRISFNFGPTLLSYLKKKKRELYEKIIESDVEARRYFNGIGPAIAQCFNHIIMPLAKRQDKIIQVKWGIRDFYLRFKRLPMGMWLPETAVDLETLSILAENGIRFTILSPYQAEKVRKIGEDKWVDVKGGRIDTKRPYLCFLPNNKTISIFFYNKDISHDVAFGGLLRNGEGFAKRLISAFENKDEPQIVNIATDGETYGHHHKYGDMALSYCLHYIESNKLAKITNYYEYLQKFQPEYEVKIIENTSWSCAHGIERWKDDCGCNTGYHKDWNQKWRKPLRDGMNWLKDEIDKIYIEKISDYVNEPFEIFYDYIDFIIGEEEIEKILKRHLKREINEKEKIKIIKLLEMERMSQLMFTSCGWFFDDISNIETQQIMMYAKRAIQLAEELNGYKIEENFINFLSIAKSNIPELKDGAEIYRKFIIPSALNLENVAAHFVISDVFNTGNKKEMYCYEIESFFKEENFSGNMKLNTGRIRLRSKRTFDEGDFCFGIIHLGDQNVLCGLIQNTEENYEKIKKLHIIFRKGEITNLVREMDKIFGEHTYSLINLFKDEQRKIIDTLLKETYKELQFSLTEFYEKNSGILNFLFETKTPFPEIIKETIQYVLNNKAKEIIKEKNNPFELEGILEELKRFSLNVDKTTLGFIITETLNRLFSELWDSIDNVDILKKIESYLKISNRFGIELNLWKAQNSYFYIGEKYYPEKLKESEKEKKSKEWIEIFERLKDYLYVHLEEL